MTSKYKEMLDEAITQGSNVFYAAQERQVLQAKNKIGQLISESRLRVDKKVLSCCAPSKWHKACGGAAVLRTRSKIRANRNLWDFDTLNSLFNHTMAHHLAMC